MIYKGCMEQFRVYLQKEFIKRNDKNENYSLRAFANHIGLNHGTLSSILSGKRKISRAKALEIAQALGMGPQDVETYLGSDTGETVASPSYYLLQQDNFALMSEWYFDAILEMSLIKGARLEPAAISSFLGISQTKAENALEVLVRLELLKKDEQGQLQLSNKNTTNILDSDFSNAAMKKHQQMLLEKSSESIDQVERADRDHSSVTVAIDKNDLGQVKQIIKKFRKELSAFVQREGTNLSDVYQLQVGFFPLNKKETNNKESV